MYIGASRRIRYDPMRWILHQSRCAEYNCSSDCPPIRLTVQLPPPRLRAPLCARIFFFLLSRTLSRKRPLHYKMVLLCSKHYSSIRACEVKSALPSVHSSRLVRELRREVHAGRQPEGVGVENWIIRVEAVIHVARHGIATLRAICWLQSRR